jgi:phospholipid/cholesterol/gamma-HCH transport system ATP-binding protein
MTTAQPVSTVPAAVEAIALSVGHGGNALLSSIDFSIAPGEIFAIIGRSGCGKSTLLRTLVGLSQPLAGEVRIFSQKLPAAGEPGYAAIAGRFAVLFQGGALWTSMTLRENVALPLERHGGFSAGEIADLVGYKLALVGLSASADRYPHELSGGMALRGAIARALALDPPLLLLDEPTSSLDPSTARRLDELILTIRRCLGTAIVFVSHDLTSILEGPLHYQLNTTAQKADAATLAVQAPFANVSATGERYSLDRFTALRSV